MRWGIIGITLILLFTAAIPVSATGETSNTQTQTQTPPTQTQTQTQTAPTRDDQVEQQLLIINKKTNRLAFFSGGVLVKEFVVGTGKNEDLTPEGYFTIIQKIKNRPYYKDNIPGGDPRNPLGDRWMGLSVPGTWGSTYGIHGNNNESSVGKYVSLGCIRMYNKEVRWLFDQVTMNTPVLITSSENSFEELAQSVKYDLKTDRIETVEMKLTLLSETPLYNKPSKYTANTMALSPQKVSAFEKVDGWYRIKTWYGDGWIRGKQILEGEVEPIELVVDLPVKTYIYSLPNDNATAIGALAPQKVKAFAEWNGWFRIRSWLGDVWIKVDGDN